MTHASARAVETLAARRTAAVDGVRYAVLLCRNDGRRQWRETRRWDTQAEADKAAIRYRWRGHAAQVVRCTGDEDVTAALGKLNRCGTRGRA